ncbi:MAG: family 43 glycosylhydrolase [Lachnospiraceae bacterium]|nr:family 43 glycosylhydrolase [Lachnospiraceae bacterium]
MRKRTISKCLAGFLAGVLAFTGVQMPDAATADTVQAAEAESSYDAGYLWLNFGTEDGYEKIFLGYSEDGLTWEKLNKEDGTAKSILDTVNLAGSDKGVRDPHLIRSADGSKYWILATDLHAEGGGAGGSGWNQLSASQNIVVWESEDLVNWSEPRLVYAGFEDAGCVWAPEAIYDEEEGNYVVYWSARDKSKADTNENALRVYVCRTEDFVEFTEPKVWLSEDQDSGDEVNIIDTTIVEDNGKFYRFSTSDWNTVVDVSDTLDTEDVLDVRNGENTSTPNGSWQRIVTRSGSFGAGFNGMEGLTVYQLPSGQWCAMGDNDGYKAYVANDLSSGEFELVASNFVDGKFRHGTVIRLSKEEEAAVLAAYKTDNSDGENQEEEKTEPILTYDFDESLSGTTIADKSGNNYTGKLYGSATYATDSDKGQVLYLDGSSGTYAELPQGLFDGRNKVSVSFDVKPVTISGNYFTFTFGQNDNKYMFLKTEDKYSRFSMTSNGYKNEETISTSTDSIKEKWINVKLVVDYETVSMYMDNILVSRNNNIRIRTTDLGENIISYLGKSFYSGDAYFKGYFDNVKVYNRALTEYEIAKEAGKEDSIEILKGITSKDVGIVKTELDKENATYTLYATKYDYDVATRTRKAADLENVTLDFDLTDGAEVKNAKESYNLMEDFEITVGFGGDEKTYTVSTVIVNNPVLGGEFADPDIDAFNGKYYLYCTSDGFQSWGGYKFRVFSSEDLITWKDEGQILNLRTDVAWSDGSAWAPSIEEKNGKYYFYFCGNDIRDPQNQKKAIGVAVADSPTGPFVAEEEPLVTMELCGTEGVTMGQCIDPSIFTEEDGTSYMLFGNGNAAIVQLGDDMISTVPGTMHNYVGATDFRESIIVNKIDGKYHFTWSCDDTGSENYHVKYGVSDSLYGDIEYKCQLLVKDVANNIKGTGHHSTLQVPGTDDFYIAYHRFLTPLGQVTSGYGYHRETCIDKLIYNEETGLFEVAKATLTGLTEGQTHTAPKKYHVTYEAGKGGSISGVEKQVVIDGYQATAVKAVPKGGYKFVKWSDGSTETVRKETEVNADMAFTAEFAKLTDAEKAVYDSKLLAYFSFDDETSGFSGKGAVGSAEGTAELATDGASGSALSLDGAGYVDVTAEDGSSLLAGKDEITISYYSKVEGTGTNWSVYAAPDEGQPEYEYETYFGVLDRANEVVVQRYMNDGKRAPSVNGKWNDTSWKHVVISVEQDKTTLYINGQNKGSVTSEYTLSDILGNDGILYLGKAMWTGGEYMTGLMDEFKIYDGALTAEDISAIAIEEIIPEEEDKQETPAPPASESDGSKKEEETAKDPIPPAADTPVTPAVTTPTAELILADNPAIPTGKSDEAKKAKFGVLKAQVKKATKNSNKVQWSKVADAEGYVVLGNIINSGKKKYPYEVLTIIENNTTTSYTHKNLKKDTYYKYIVQAYKMVDGKVSILETSKTVYSATKNKKYANVKAIKVNKTKVSLAKKGKKFTIKAKQTKNGKKLISNRDLSFESSNTKVATVSSKGIITAKKKGKCTIYVYAQNGIYKTISVTVKK